MTKKQTNLDDTLYDEYITLCQKIDLLSQKKDILKEKIIKQFKENNLESIKSDLGIITLAKMSRWQYSPNVKAKEEEVKTLKKEEENKGIATQTFTEFIKTKLR